MLDRRDFLVAGTAAAAFSAARGQNTSAAAAQNGQALPPVPTEAPKPEGPLVTPAFAKMASETRYAAMPADVVEACKWFLLDTIGCGLAGHAADKPKAPIALAKAVAGTGSRILGSGEVANPGAVAFANGELINSLDYDCLPHSAAYIVAPALAVAEAHEASGQDLILAVTIGLDIADRLNRNTSTMGSVDKTGLTPNVFGNSNDAIIGGAASLASLLKLDANKTAHAIGLAAYFCAVPYSHDWELRSPKSMVKYGPAGPSCQGAYNAAVLASHGYTGDPLALDGPQGFVMFYERHQWDAEAVLRGLGQQWSVVRTGYKPFAACKFVHSQIEALATLLNRTQLRPEEIVSIHSLCFPFVANLEMMNVRTQVDAQFSIPYVLALTAHGVPLDAHAYDWSRMNDPAIRATMQKITWTWRPDALTLRANSPRSFPCTVEVQARGQKFTESLDTPPTTLLPGVALSKKFLANAAVCLSPSQARSAHDMILHLDEVKNVQHLIDTLVTV